MPERTAHKAGNRTRPTLREYIEDAIVQTGAKLMILDPVQGYLGDKVDMNRANEIRSVLKKVAAVAERTGCAIVLVGHLNKAQGSNSSYRGLGSIDFRAAARSVLLVGRLKKEPHVRVIVHDKSSLAPEGKSLAFSLGTNAGFSWLDGYNDISSEELLCGYSNETKTSIAERLIRDMLEEGREVNVNEILSAAKGKDISERTVNNAKSRIPNIQTHLLVDEETAPIVNMIFDLCAVGNGPWVIANMLREKEILKPTVYRYRQTGNYGCITDTDDIYGWNDRTVAGILDNEIYLGNTVNCKTTVASYKDKRTINRPESEWLRFENTHEAIVDPITWDIVRKVRAGKRRRTNMGEVNKYSGILHCADCGSKLYFVRGRTVKPENYGFICSRYRKHLGVELCTPHSIKERVLDEMILEEIRKVTYYARSKTKEFIEFINRKSSSENRKELTAKTNELSKMERRNTELNALFKRLYEDNVLGKVTNEQFRMLSDGYNAEQCEIKEQIPKLQVEIEELKAAVTNVEEFLNIACNYTDLQELTPEVLRTFITKVVIHERENKWSKTAEQEVDIYFRYIGNISSQSAEQAG